MLVKKVDALTKAIEVESKKMKREAAAREKEAASVKVADNRKNSYANSSVRFVKSITESLNPFSPNFDSTFSSVLLRIHGSSIVILTYCIENPR
jgi:predicted Holliday junction resolvase-like endonuclease